MQYPQIQRLGPRRALFRHAMPWPTRMLLILVGTVMLVGCAIALFFLGLLAWATITA